MTVNRVGDCTQVRNQPVYPVGDELGDRGSGVVPDEQGHLQVDEFR